MKNLTLAVFINLLFFGCVKDPINELKLELFELKINDTSASEIAIIADKTKRYKIEIAANDTVLIDNDKEITISVTNGLIAAIENIGATTPTQLITKLNGNKATFYYVPSSEPSEDCLISFKVGSYNQVAKFPLKASESDIYNYQPTI